MDIFLGHSAGQDWSRQRGRSYSSPLHLGLEILVKAGLGLWGSSNES